MESETRTPQPWDWIGFPPHVAALKFQFFKSPVAAAADSSSHSVAPAVVSV
jgi:hypothetical protein